jgi:lipopolysaccharide/colanic/teichoic acid biosynthesis glycosyltransferase
MDSKFGLDNQQTQSPRPVGNEVEWLKDPPPYQRVLKRAFDIFFSTILLLVLAPLLIVIPAIIKLSSRGPIFFGQRRLGYHGKQFTFLKFRSMYVDRGGSKQHSEYLSHLVSGQYGEMGTSADFKIKHDPRITPIGRFMRKTSLDELPLFFSVLAGDMSLVGPRPPVPYEWDSYEDWHKKRLSCKPGITGLWQVSDRSRVSFDDMVKLDLQYAQSQSIWLDLKILARTPWIALTGHGAY